MKLLIKYKEQISYLFFGVLTTLLNVFLFWLFTEKLHLKASVANIPAAIICIVFAYVTNKLFVFESKDTNKQETLKEFIKFISGRLGTTLIGELIILIGADILHFPNMYVKLFEQGFQVVGNYLISKLFVFKK